MLPKLKLRGKRETDKKKSQQNLSDHGQHEELEPQKERGTNIEGEIFGEIKDNIFSNTQIQNVGIS